MGEEVTNKVLSTVSRQDIDYGKIYNEMKQEISQLEDKERIQRLLKRKHMIPKNEYELKGKLHRELKSKFEKAKEPIKRINTDCVELSTKLQQVLDKLGKTRGLGIQGPLQ